MTTPNNLPAELSSFVGRERQLAELRRLMRRSRLVTVTGPGGAGKTRLGLRLAAGALDRHPDGVWFVGLAGLDDGQLLEHVVASGCGVREERRRSMLDVLSERLGSRRTLLILDGCERLVEPCAAMVNSLLRSCPWLTLLVTSREPLGVPGELIWRIPSLTVPGPEGAGRTDLLLKSEAVLLFIDRARLAQPTFNLDRTLSGEVAEVCTRLEGLPLAIELAASLVSAMTVHEIRGRLSDRFRLLTGGSRAAVPRHQTLRLAVDWSYGLLSPDEKILFGQLAVFADGFDVDAAEAVGGLDAKRSADVLPILLRLVDKSLVIAEEREPSRMRYRLLDTIREYALEKLQPEACNEAQRRHAMYFLEFCSQTATALRLREQAYWLERIEEDEANIRLALAWCQGEAPDKLISLSRHMARFWFIRGKFIEGLEWLDRAVLAADSPEARLAPLLNRAILRRHHGDYEDAKRDLIECVNLARQQGLTRPLMVATSNLGALSGAGGEFGEAELYSREALQIGEQLGDNTMITGSLNNLALVESARGNHTAAKVLIDQMLHELSRVDDRMAWGVFLESAGRVERRAGAHEAARQRFLEALQISSELADMMNMADILDGLAMLALAEADPARVLVLVAASSRQRDACNSERSPWDDEEVQRGAAQARAMLGQRAADSASKRGSAMSLAEAIAYASWATAVRANNGGTALTRREMQVASLIAEGLTNLEIAGRLKMAGRTADAHVEHIRNKLGLRTRAQIAVWAHDQPVEA